MSTNSKLWWKAAGVRAVKTMAQTCIAVIGTGVVGVMDVDWLNLLSVTLVSGFLSLVTSLAGLPEVELEEER